MRLAPGAPLELLPVECWLPIMHALHASRATSDGRILVVYSKCLCCLCQPQSTLPFHAQAAAKPRLLAMFQVSWGRRRTILLARAVRRLHGTEGACVQSLAEVGIRSRTNNPHAPGHMIFLS